MKQNNNYLFLKMGKIWTKLFPNRECRCLMLGLDAAGKTTILYKLKLDEVVSTIPTIGFNVETISHGKLDINVWDIGGQDKIRPLWKHYYKNVDALIFVVDSSDRERLEEARKSLHEVVRDLTYESPNVVLLIYSNKTDLPHSMSFPEVKEGLALDRLKVKWFMQRTNAISGDGLYEGLEWLSSFLKKKSKRSKYLTL